MTRRDDGFSLMEILVVVVILGVLGMILVMVVFGFKSEVQASSCTADANVLVKASEAYFAQSSSDTIPASGAGPESIEQTLINIGMLRAHSEFHDLSATGQVVQVTDSPCTV